MAALDPSDPFPAPSWPAKTASARPPALPVLATTPTPLPMPLDDVPRLPLTLRVRASLAAALAGTGRTSWRVLLASCTASAFVSAVLAAWLTTVTSEPRAAPVVAIERETAVTPLSAPSAGAHERGVAGVSLDAKRRLPAAAPAPAARLVGRMPAAADAPALEADPEAAAPDRAEASDAASAAPVEAARSAPAESSEPGAEAQPPVASDDATTPDSAPVARQGSETEAGAALPAATAAAVPEDAQPAQPAEAGEASPTPTPIAAAAEGVGAEPVPAKATLPSGLPTDGDSPTVPEVL